jgi:hypothetical protein
MSSLIPRKSFFVFVFSFSILCIAITRSYSSEQFFPKVSWTDIYWMRWLPIEQRTAYWGQIDSAGFNLAVGIADSISTRNGYGIKYIGQSDKLVARDNQGFHHDIGDIVKLGYDARFEAEQITYDSTKGYLFQFTTGTYDGDSTAFGGGARKGVAGLNPAGYLVFGFDGVKSYVQNGTDNLVSLFRLKVSDNSGHDTICSLEASALSGTKVEQSWSR